MKRILGILICAIGVICGFSLPVFADLTWTQTTFINGTGVFTSTQPANGNADATLLSGALDTGTGADGAFDSSTYNGVSIPGITGTAPNISIDTGNATKLGTYNFTTFNIAAGHTVTVSGANFLIIKATGNATINGTLNGSGGNGVNGSASGVGGGGGGGGAVKITSAGNITINAGGIIQVNGGNGGGLGAASTGQPGGPGGPGGGAGGNGCTGSGGQYGVGTGGGIGGWYGGGSGGGYGGTGGQGVRAGGSGTYGTADLSTFYAGSGGGGACISGGGGGGGSGGAVFLQSNNITISGNIQANGGNGVAGTDGGGGGGRIRLESPNLTGGANAVASGGTGTNNGAAGTVSTSGTLTTGYASVGNYLSAPISPGVSQWGVLTYTVTIPANTTLTIDVLDSSNNVLISNAANGVNLSATISATTYQTIKLRANFTTTVGTSTPTLSDWSITYTPGNVALTSNWTSIVKAANKVAMGNAVAVISFTASAITGTMHWRRFRIDETGGQPIEKLSVSVYEESGNDGFFDAADKFIASGTFNSNRTCYLNMNRWPLGTTAKTYYIVEKVALDGSGGQTIRLNIADGSYFDFEEGPVVGVQP